MPAVDPFTLREHPTYAPSEEARRILEVDGDPLPADEERTLFAQLKI